MTAYGSLKFLNLDYLVAVLIRDCIKQQNADKVYTDTPLLENSVYSSKVSGLQTYTNVYSVVYSTILKKRSFLLTDKSPQKHR